MTNALHHPASIAKKSIGFANLAVLIEWYDFGLYTVFSIYLYQIFFPTIRVDVSGLLMMFVYWLGYLGRVIGGCVFSRFADTSGRKSTFIISSSVMSISTLLLLLIPTHGEPSIIISISFIAIRLLQGLALGIEYPGGMVYIYEHAKSGQQFPSLLRSSFFSQLGGLIGVASGLILSHLFTHAEIIKYAWRLPYAFAFLSGILLFLMRFFAHETPAFIQQSRHQSSFSYASIVKRFFGGFLGLFLMMIAMEGMVKFISMGNLYFNRYFDIPLKKLFFISTISFFTTMSFTLLLSFYLSNTKRITASLVGLSIFLVIGCLGFLLMAPHSLIFMMVSICLISCAGTVFNKYVVYLICQSSETQSRVSMVAFYNNLSVLFSTLSPLLLLAMVQRLHYPMLVSESFFILSVVIAWAMIRQCVNLSSSRRLIVESS